MAKCFRFCKKRKGSMTDSDNSEEKKNNRQSPITLLKEFCGYTTFGGLARVIGSPYLLFRGIWFLLFVGGFVVAIVQLIALYRTYEMKPISTKISLHHKQPLSFPTVTVCNFNAVRLSKVIEAATSPAGQAILAEIIKLVEQKRRRANSSLINEAQSFLSDDDDDEGYINPEHLLREHKFNELYSIAMAKIPPEDLIPLGHQFEDMITSCSWRGVDCKTDFASGRYWGTFWHYRYGNCFVFNPLNDWRGRRRKSPRSAFRAGSSYGLTLQLNIEQSEYINYLAAQKAGAVIQVTPHGIMPFPAEEGLSVAPGFSTSIALTKVVINRVDAFKNRTCVNRLGEIDKNNLYHLFYNASYSQTACMESCVAYNQLKHCDCMEYRFPKGKTKRDVCFTLESKTVKCLRSVSQKLRQQKLNCTKMCPSPCNEETYKVTSSFAAWPSLSYQSSLEELLKENQTNTSIPNNHRDNILEVRIFYKELNYEAIQESVSYEFVNFLADIGGQLGLWLGVSVLTGAEVLELIVLIVISLYRRSRRKGNKDKPDELAMEPVLQQQT